MVKANNKVAAKKGANGAVEKTIQKPVVKDAQKQKVAKAAAIAHVVKPSKKQLKQPVDEDESDDSQDVSEGADSDEEELQQGVEAKPANRLTGVSVFVGNLPASTKRTQLEALFTPHTKVLRIRFRKPNGGQLFKTKRTSLASLIAFVDVPTAEEAKKVAAALHQHNFRGNLLRVSADKQENTSGNEKRTVFVGNLTYATTDKQLHETFECCGEIDYVRSIQSKEGCKGTAFVAFKDAASVQMALELNKGELNGRPITVTKCLSKDKADQKKQTKSAANARIAAKPAAGKAGAAANGKPEFTGAKVNADKKNNNKKNKGAKGGLSGPKLLAKKIAPKVQKVTA